MSNQKKEFLKEYNALIRKHQMYIGGCGCCHSPFVCDTTEWNLVGETSNDKLDKHMEHLQKDFGE